jgi:hypothetical protein
VFKEKSGAPDYDVLICQATHGDSIARVEGEPLIELLPYSISSLAHYLLDDNEATAPLARDYLMAFEAYIINLLLGSLAEAGHVYNRDAELFNHKLVDL